MFVLISESKLEWRAVQIIMFDVIAWQCSRALWASVIFFSFQANHVLPKLHPTNKQINKCATFMFILSLYNPLGSVFSYERVWVNYRYLWYYYVYSYAYRCVVLLIFRGLRGQKINRDRQQRRTFYSFLICFVCRSCRQSHKRTRIHNNACTQCRKLYAIEKSMNVKQTSCKISHSNSVQFSSSSWKFDVSLI